MARIRFQLMERIEITIMPPSAKYINALIYYFVRTWAERPFSAVTYAAVS